MRLCTFNVHGWVDAERRPNFSRVVRLLGRLDCDVIALQEATRGLGFAPAWGGYEDDEEDEAEEGEGEGHEFERLARALGMHVVEARAGWGANLLLSRARPTREATVLLGRGRSETRSAALATLPTPWGPVVFAATHLDHLDESSRVRQLGELAEILGDRDAVTLGDFNALRPSDYRPERLQEIEEARERYDLDPVEDDLVRAADRLGWVDLVRLGVAGGGGAYRASLAEPIPEGLAGTSHYGTRVDYVWATGGLAARLDVPEFRVVDDGTSDHGAVVVTLAPARATTGVRANPSPSRPALSALGAFFGGRAPPRARTSP